MRKKLGRSGEGVREKGEGVLRKGIFRSPDSLSLLLIFRTPFRAVSFPSRTVFGTPATQANICSVKTNVGHLLKQVCFHSGCCSCPFRKLSMPFSRINEFSSAKLKEKKILLVTTQYRTRNLSFLTSPLTSRHEALRNVSQGWLRKRYKKNSNNGT